MKAICYFSAIAIASCLFGHSIPDGKAGPIGGRFEKSEFISGQRVKRFTLQCTGRTRVRVISRSGQDMDVKVTGALTGVVYGEDRRLDRNAIVEFSSLPGIFHIDVRNYSSSGGSYELIVD